MANGDIAKEMTAKRSVEIKASLLNAEWDKCEIGEMKDAMIFLVDGMDALPPSLKAAVSQAR